MLTLAAVKLALDDLFDKRHAALVKSKSGKLAEDELAEIRGEIDALPRALTTATPLTEQVGAADDRHDEAGRTIFFATESVLHDAGAPADALAAAKRARAELMTGLDEVTATLTVEASRAKDRRALLADKAFVAAMQLIPLAGDRSLLDAARAYIDAGEELATLMSDRSDVQQPDRSKASALRPKALGALTDLRKMLKKEVARDAKLPRDLEAQVFAYVDQLAAEHKARKPKPKAEPTPVVAPADVVPPKTTDS